MTSRFRRIAVICLASVMTASLAAGNALAVTQNVKNGLFNESAGIYDTVNFTNVTGKVDLTDIALKNLSSGVKENKDYKSAVSGVQSVIVTLKGQSLIESKSEGQTVSDYAASFSGQMAAKRISDEQNYFLDLLERSCIDYKLGYSYNTVMNGVSLDIDVRDIEKVRNMPQVQSVVFAERYAFPKSEEAAEGAVSNPSNVYRTGIYDSSEYLSYGRGENIKVAVLDTGIDYTHKAFSTMPAEYEFTREVIAEKLSGTEFAAETASANRGVNITVDDVFINEKIPFAYDYADKDTDVYPSYSQHGTHVAGIISGQADSYTNKDGVTELDENGNAVKFSGVAPDVQLVICKIFTDDFDDPDLGGAKSEDIIAALEDCANLGVDIINMSIGTTSGFGSISIEGDTEGEQLNAIYERLRDEGISVLAAAGNEFSAGFGSAYGTNRASNPDSGTVGSPSTFDGSLSVASINGQLSRYMNMKSTVNGAETDTPVFYLESSRENGVQNDFCADVLKADFLKDRYVSGMTKFKFKYVVVPGVGQPSDYNATVKALINDKSEGPVIVLVKRGTSTFKDKVEIAERMGADAIIIYNNVAGTIRMSLGDIDDPIPAISVTFDAGNAMARAAGSSRKGYIEVNADNQAGPFMNDYSSWGATPDLKLKPEITSHGGEITSTVAGGYAEMSGTSMATPNLAGFAALLRGYLKEKYPDATSQELTRLTNQLTMSTAIVVRDQDGLAYSPRKQGAGLATLANVFSSQAYLSTEKAEDNRPKVELGDDKQKKGVYELEFFVNNFGDKKLEFTTNSLFMTETLSSDGLAVTEQAHMLGGSPEWSVDGVNVAEGGKIEVAAGAKSKISVKLTLSAAEKKYINDSFPNGMYIEGFLRLISDTEGQCDLSLPFMGFFGDWEAAPLLDYNAFEIAEFQQDASYTDETRPQPQVFATQAYGAYANDKYYVPLGSFLFTQNEDADQIYTDEEHIAVSRYNDYYGYDSNTNYYTVTSIRALYAGLLRNVELATFDLYNDYTGERIEVIDPETGLPQRVYRIGKALANGGSAIPSLVDLKLSPDALGLEANGKYRMQFHFYRQAKDLDDPTKQDNMFEMTFYVDYEAPVLVESRIRYYNYKDGNKEKQNVYLDLDVFDNTYAQSVILCYSEEGKLSADGSVPLNLATDYVTPIYNSVKNGINTVSIDITDIYEKYNGRLYVQLDDYALNHNVYTIDFGSAKASGLPVQFEFADDGRIITNTDGSKELTISLNEAYKLKLDYEGSANLSNFTWTSGTNRNVRINNNEIFGRNIGDSVITVTGADGASKTLKVHVQAGNNSLPVPDLTFGAIPNSTEALQKAQGSVRVNAGQSFTLEIVAEPWYYPVDSLNIEWSSSKPEIATVDSNGRVQVFDKKGLATIKAEIVDENGVKRSGAQVILNVQDPFTVNGTILTKYHGTGGVVEIPIDKNITQISDEAFKDNDNITTIIIPKTVTQIGEQAFRNCSALEYVYFISEEAKTPADCDLSLIMRYAFAECKKLKKVDLSNCKTITLDLSVFYGCTSLEEIVKLENIGTAGDDSFYGCTSLKSVDLSGLHSAGARVFAECTSLREVTTKYYTDLGESMFENCTALREIELNVSDVPENAFSGCSGLKKVVFGASKLEVRIGAGAFLGCSQLEEFNLNGNRLVSVGDAAFYKCTQLTELQTYNVGFTLGDQVFAGTNCVLKTPDSSEADGAVYSGDTLVSVPRTANAVFEIKPGTKVIGAYAFSNFEWKQGDPVRSIIIPNSVEVIGEGAFAHCPVESIVLPANIKEIPAYAFYDTKLTSVTIPAGVERIGGSAFQGNMSLSSVTFENASALKEIGDSAFSDCLDLVNIALPDGAVNCGSFVFAGCVSLEKATLPSVTVLGSNTFYGCYSLKEVKFGKNATTAGTDTFFTGYAGTDEYGNAVPAVNALVSVELGDKTTVLGAGVFAYCVALQNIDIKNITLIGDRAFAGCALLRTVNGLNNVSFIGDAAFADCSNLTSLDLKSAQYIGNSAFFITGGGRTYTLINVPAAVSIGASAFSGGSEQTVNLPATLQSVGAGAFANSSSLTSITVDAANKIFFSEEGVLYRIIDAGSSEKSYELIAYPSNRAAESYAIKEGTVSVLGYAFADLNAKVDEVIIPYSVKVIGHAAFVGSGISEYVFHAINAPTLLTEYYHINMQSTDNTPVNYYSLFYMNFEDDFLRYSNVSSAPAQSALKIKYPSNGVGYDNYIYRLYFGQKTVISEMPETDTRRLKQMIEGFASADEVSGWISLAVNDENKAKVVAFSEEIKQAHILYNNIRGQVQLDFVGEANVNKLFAIESALKAVKSKFGIAVRVTGITVSSDSTHKSEYKAGERFDMTGLKLIVTYDDYSTQQADLSQMSFAEGYDRELDVLDVEVRLTGYGRMVRVGVTVTPADDNPSREEPPVKGGCNGGGCGGNIISAAGIFLVAAAAVVVLRVSDRRKKFKKNRNCGDN